MGFYITSTLFFVLLRISGYDFSYYNQRLTCKWGNFHWLRTGNILCFSLEQITIIDKRCYSLYETQNSVFIESRFTF